MKIKSNRNIAKHTQLRYWRDVAEITQEDFAVLLGCNRSNYCQKENGKVEFKLSEMRKIQKALNEKLEKPESDQLSIDQIFLP